MSDSGAMQLVPIPSETHIKGSTQIQHIPTEILGEIFLRSLPKARHPSLRLTPLLLCQICSHWRNVALSLNQLWDELSLLYDYSDGRLNISTSATKNWFGRAGPHIQLSFAISYLDKQLCNCLLEEILIPLAHRFRHVDLIWDGGVDFMPFFARCPQVLESAVFRFSDSIDATEITHIDVASLRKVSLSSVTSFSPNPQLSDRILTCDRLTHLIITESTDAQTLVEMLSRCRNIHKVACVIVGIDHRSLLEQLLPAIDQPVTLPHLYAFEMTLHRETGHSFLPLFRLRFPMLHRFRLCDSSLSNGEILGGEGIHFTSQPHLITNLGLSGHTMTTAQLLELLCSTSGLVTLELDVRVRHDEICRALTRFPNYIGLVPRLEDFTLHLKFQDFLRFSTRAFIDMVRSRQIPIGPGDEPISYIRNISILVPQEGQPILDDVKRLLQMGSSKGLPADRALRKNCNSNPFSITDVNLASW